MRSGQSARRVSKRQAVRRALLVGGGLGVLVAVAIFALLGFLGRNSDPATDDTASSGTDSAAVTTGGAQADRAWFDNPVLEADAPDPHLVRHGDEVLVFTTNADGLHVPLHRTHDLRSWAEPVDALPDLPLWVSPAQTELWAPAVLSLGERWLLAFAARHRDTGLFCIGLASAAQPDEPFVAQPEPTVCDTEIGLIDPFLVADEDIPYLLWKRDGNCCSQPSEIVAARLDDDLAVGDPSVLIDRSLPWEQGSTDTQATVENPALVSTPQGWILLYSGNGWESADYAMGYARCDTPMGPCTKTRRAPVLAGDSAARGPGGGSVLELGEGLWLLAYHAWGEEIGYDEGGRRTLRMDLMQMLGSNLVVTGPTVAPYRVELPGDLKAPTGTG